MHHEAFEFVRGVVQSLPRLHHVVEFGSRVVNGSVRPIFTDAAGPNGAYVGVDLTAGVGVDVVASADTYAPPWQADCVVCCEVLEHTPLGAEIIANAYRCLRPGGVLIVTAANRLRAPHSGIDGGTVRDGEYYDGVLCDSVRQWCQAAGFAAVVAQSVGEDLQAIAWRAR